MMHVSETKWTELETQRPTKKKKELFLFDNRRAKLTRSSSYMHCYALCFVSLGDSGDD